MGAIKNAFSSQIPYGFQQSETLYTIPDYAKKATKFKNEYFKKLNPKYNTSFKIHKGTLNVSPVTVESNIPVELVEHEFWRLIDHVGTHINEDINVEYGADIEVVKNGSGMPHYRFNNNHAKKEECKDYRVVF